MSISQPPSGLQTTLRTERLKLRLIDPDSQSDLEEYVRLYNSHRKDAGGSDNLPPSMTVDYLRLKHELHSPKAELCTLSPPPKGYIHLIYLLNDNGEDALIGNVNMAFRPEMSCPDLGYAILPAYHGQGYATEAARESLRFWHEEVGVKDIFAGTAKENVKSQNVVKRLGFVEGGWSKIVFGLPPDEKMDDMKVFVLPGMGQWPEGQVLKHTASRG